jgi:hypothetical protein
MIHPEDLSLYKLTDDAQAAVHEILGFFRVYHSMRYVRDRLVLRLNEPIGARLVDELNRGFSDILVEGRLVVGGPLPEERDEPDLADLPRLIFHFDRHHLGRLRQLIDRINRDAP